MKASAGTGRESLFSDRTEIVVIGTQPEDRAIEKKGEELLDGFIGALQDFNTETLLAIAEFRHRVNPEGWMQHAIWGYVDVWR